MKELFACANQYVRESDWKDMALLKVCLCAMGVLLGIQVPKEKKTCVSCMAGTVFIMTYVPLMMKFVKIVLHMQSEKNKG